MRPRQVCGRATGSASALGRLKGSHAELASQSDQDSYDTGVNCNPHIIPDLCVTALPGQHASCQYFDSNPNHNINSFDSVAMVFIAFIQAVTFDDWATGMYALMSAFSPYVWIYYILIVMVAGLFVVNRRDSDARETG